jgi:NAD-dependent SIR2 family protein deacetylase
MAKLHLTSDARVRRLTQNIDSLENLAGLPAHMTVAAHGNFDRCSCIATGAAVPVEEVRAAIAHGKHGPEGWLAMAERHGGLVKPDIVFFGDLNSLSPIHVGVYVGDRSFTHSSVGTGVSFASLDDTYWKPRFLGARRLQR